MTTEIANEYKDPTMKLYASLEEMEADMSATLKKLIPNASDRDALLNRVRIALDALKAVFETVDKNTALKTEVEDWKGFHELSEGCDRWLKLLNSLLIDSLETTSAKKHSYTVE